MSVTISNSHYNHNSIFTSPSSSSPSSKMCCSFSRSYAAVDGSSTAAMKRKRPGMIEVPKLPLGFIASTSRNIGGDIDVVVEEQGKNGIYSVYCKKGRRAFLEDRFSVEIDVLGDDKQAIFGVFDGHGGAKAAEYAAKNLNKNIIAEIVKADDEQCDTEAAIKQGYLKTDSDFLEGEFQGGSCCVTALITKGHLVVSNAGDCRAVMSRGGVAEALTTDHRPSRQDEKSRIESKGGYIDCYNGVWRIQGSLAVSRGIGDRQLKQWVIAEPDTKALKISSNDEFLILASDGLWDKVTNQEAVDIIRPLCISNDKPLPPPLAACKKLVDTAVSRGSLDDISVMIIPLEQYMQ